LSGPVGNPDTHVVLRGGRSGPNFGREHLEHAWSLLGRPSGRRLLLVDCAHGNSGKDPARQGPVCRAVLDEVLAGRQEIMGLALESNLRAGSQVPAPRADLAHGVSVTDPCIGWEETRRLLTEAAAVVDKRV
jgi:3-deoxy-7-phosphoheptulonate synthase